MLKATKQSQLIDKNHPQGKALSINESLAWRKSYRYFVERDNQDAKSKLGWDEFQVIKYQAWKHQLVLYPGSLVCR